MRRTLYLKFLIAYLIFGVFGFIIVDTFMEQMTMNRLERDKADSLYREATTIAENYALSVYNNETSLTSLKETIDKIAQITGSKIQIVSPSGIIVASSLTELNVDEPDVIQGFDVTALRGSFYSVGNFYNTFSTPHITVSSPIT